MHRLSDHGRVLGLMIVVLGLLGLRIPAARAQQPQQPDQPAPQNQSGAPTPAYHAPLLSGDDNDTQDNSQEPSPDTRPLAGMQNLALGGLETHRSYWQPRVDVAASGDSNPRQNTANTNWTTWTSLAGGVDVQQISGGSELILGYTGGFIYSNDRSRPNGVVQELNFADRFVFRRASVTLLDQFSYLPEQSFGFGGLGGVPLPGGVATGPGLGAVPGQTILAGQGQNLMNSYFAQVDLYLTPRSSLTIAGGNSVLHYFNSGLLDTVEVIGRVGYNYQLSRKNTIAVLYNFQAIRYRGFQQSINAHMAQVSYGRRITGRLAFQIAGGPEVAVFHTPISSAATSSTQIYWSLNTALQYQLQRNFFGLNYSHGVSGGSGVLGGAINDTAGGSATRRMSRTFTSGITAGYSRNNGLTTGKIPSNQSYSYWFTGATLSHPLGRTLGVTLSYQMQYQDSNLPFCIGLTCGTNLMRHSISLGLGWHERPLLF
jgi:hypothetical protein